MPNREGGYGGYQSSQPRGICCRVTGAQGSIGLGLPFLWNTPLSLATLIAAL